MLLNKSCKQLRDLLQKDCIPIIGAFNGLTGRMIAQKGFQSCYISGAALTGSKGLPDIGLATLPEFCQIIKEVHLSSGLPVIADADTGFGEGEMCAKTVLEYYQAGAAGLHIEDQVFPKRCGHLDGKALISIEDMVKKIEIMRKTSEFISGGDFIVCARTDARGVLGLEETIKRSKYYIDAGADMIFPEGLNTVEEFQVVAQELRKHNQKIMLLANMTEFGKTPIIPVQQFKDMGYNCVIYPVTTLRVAMQAIDKLLDDILLNQSQTNSINNMYTRKQLYSLLDYTPGQEWYYPNPTKKQ